MDIQGQSAQSRPNYSLMGADSQRQGIAPNRLKEAVLIDADRDGVCSDAEIESYMRSRDIMDCHGGRADVPALVREFKSHLTNTAAPGAKDYRSLEQIEERMHHLAEDHPDLVQMVSIAKTAEGRDVWAMKVTSEAQSETSHKTGVVITGTHHAREWMTPEVTLNMADEMIHGYESNPDHKRRLDNGEVWFIPVVNPDGFKFSQTDDNYWRKNRTPVMTAPNGDTSSNGEPLAYGVDLNRNYFDGNPDHFEMFRTKDDTPGSTWDDFGASDSPDDDTFRGEPGQEPELKGLMALEYGRGNIHGILDHHSYGEQLLRPWGHTDEPPATLKDYDEVGARMLAAQGDDRYDYIQSATTYPTVGSSETFHEANGIFNFTVEMGRSFQPSYSQLPQIYKAVSSADFAFIDWVQEKFPSQAPPTPPSDPSQPPSEPTQPPAEPVPPEAARA